MPDNHNPTQTIAAIYAAGLGLPDRDYYLKTEPRFADAREKYLVHVANMFKLAGYDDATAKAAAQTVFQMEKKLAENSLDNVALRDPQATDHKMTFADLKKLAPAVDWDGFFNAAKISRADLNVTEPKFLQEVDRQFRQTPMADWKTYLKWQFLHAGADQLSDPFVNENFAFYGKYLNGATELKPRWKRCAEFTDQFLGDALGKRVIGQQHGLDMIARRIQTSRARLDNPNKPIGVFMLCGTSGVGKTETALALAEALYGGEQNVITINMSEFQEAHTVSSLKGAPPGYVGYGEGGILTEAVRRRPYSVVLLDEVEKAHPDVHELFFQVFDKGRMEDGEGRMIDFKNTIILLTSNAGSELIMNMCKDPELLPDPDSLATAMTEPLQKIFPPALLGRLVVIPYYPLSDEMLGQIVRLQLNRIKRRVAENHKIPFDYSDDAVKLIVRRCNNAESGGRIIDSILTNTVLPKVSIEYLSRAAEGKELTRVELGVADDEFSYRFD